MRPDPTAEQLRPLLEPAGLDLLRRALEGFTADAVLAQFGPRGQAALDRGDLAGAGRALNSAPDPRLADLAALFLLGAELTTARARRVLAPLPVEAAVAAGLVEASGAAVRAALEIRPYAEAGSGTDGGSGVGSGSGVGAAAESGPWWVVSDLGSDARPGPLAPDHVLGVGSASLTLAQATPRRAVGRSLDVGTGCGVQALHLAGHSGEVTATDVSSRALRFAATTAALSGQDWRLRRGSLLDPVAGERFDLVVANPPFVVSAGGDGLTYRDSGLAGDAVCEALLRGVPDLLADGGTAVLLANWIVRADEDWTDRVGAWLAGGDCDGWVWQREVAGPEEYVSLWLRDAGLDPSSPDWTARYDAWCDWFERSGIAAVGMGLVTMWRADGPPVRAFDDVRQAVEQPVAGEIAAWHRRARWLRDTDDEALLAAQLDPAPQLVRSGQDLLGADGWWTADLRLRQTHGLRWEVEADEAISTLVAGCAAGATPATCLDLLAATLGDRPAAELAAAAAPVLRDLVGRGILLPHHPLTPDPLTPDPLASGGPGRG